MIRNMEKVVSETRGKIPRGYNLSCDECIRLVKMAVGGVIQTAYLKQFAKPLLTALPSEKDVKKDKRKPPQKSRGKSIAGAIPLHKQYSITFPAERKDTMRKYPLPPPEKDGYIKLSDAYKFINEAFYDGFIVAICDTPEDYESITIGQRMEIMMIAIEARKRLTR